MSIKLARLGERGQEEPAVVTVDADGGEKYFSLAPLTRDIDGSFLANDGIGRARQALRTGELPELSAAGRRVGAPIARPGSIVCIGMNYAAQIGRAHV